MQALIDAAKNLLEVLENQHYFYNNGKDLVAELRNAVQEALPDRNNLLKNKKCYLSGPIENDNPAHNWRFEPTNVMSQRFKISVFDPFADPKQQWVENINKARAEKDFLQLAKIAKQFVHKDLGVVDRCDLLVAYLPYKVATTGTHHEILTALNLRKPVLLMCPQGVEYIPIWYHGFISYDFMFGSWKEMFDCLEKVNSGGGGDAWDFVYELI